ncbi:MAG: hypothetical protein PHE56_12490 [Bacteroidales bacterium]|nr:hypothetical protein [Bacteroidales bacterium]
MSRIILLSIVVIFLFSSCEVINPPEQVPSYIAVDTLKVKITDPEQGTSIHAITDCWLYVNNKLIGVFEVPFKVPVLESGIQSIQIEPGMKNSGSPTNRDIYPLMIGWYITDTLEAGKVHTLSPEFFYRPATFDLVENFEDIGIEFEVSAESDTNIVLVSGANAQEGKSMYVALDDERPNFECRSSKLYEITKTGSAFLEISFKSTDVFSFGLFSLEYNGSTLSEVRKSVYIFNPTDEWKTVYIDLNYHVINAAGTKFRLYFTCARPDEAENEKTEVFIDNVKLVYISQN